GETLKDSIFPDIFRKTEFKIAPWISDDYMKANLLNAIARSYAGLGDKEKARALLENAIKTAERVPVLDLYRTISFDSGFNCGPLPLNSIAESYAKMGDKEEGRALLKYMEEQLNSIDYLGQLSRFYSALGDKDKKAHANVVLEDEGANTFKAGALIS